MSFLNFMTCTDTVLVNCSYSKQSGCTEGWHLVSYPLPLVPLPLFLLRDIYKKKDKRLNGCK